MPFCITNVLNYTQLIKITKLYLTLGLHGQTECSMGKRTLHAKTHDIKPATANSEGQTILQSFSRLIQIGNAIIIIIIMCNMCKAHCKKKFNAACMDHL